MPLTPKDYNDDDTSCGSTESFEDDERALYREKVAIFQDLFTTSYEPMLRRESVFAEQQRIKSIIRNIKSSFNDDNSDWISIITAASELGQENDLYKAAKEALNASIELQTLMLRPVSKKIY